MTFCRSCGFDKGEGRYCPQCGSMGGPSTGSAESTMTANSIPAAPNTPNYGYQPNIAYSSTSGNRSGAATGFGITMMIAGALGIISTFLPWLSIPWQYFFDYTSVNANAWDVRTWLTEKELFSAGPILVVVGSIAVLVMAFAILSANNQGRSANPIGLGVGFILSGLFIAGGVGATYDAVDAAIGYDFPSWGSELLGAGFAISAILSVAVIVAGILTLTIKSLTNSR